MAQDEYHSVTSTERTFPNAATAEASATGPAPKRQRIGLACSACRLRKSRVCHSLYLHVAFEDLGHLL